MKKDCCTLKIAERQGSTTVAITAAKYRRIRALAGQTDQPMTNVVDTLLEFALDRVAVAEPDESLKCEDGAANANKEA